MIITAKIAFIFTSKIVKANVPSSTLVTRPAEKTKRDVMTSHPQSLRMYRKENNIKHAQQPALEVQLRLTNTGEDNNTFLSFNFDRGEDMGGPNKKKFEKEQSNL